MNALAGIAFSVVLALSAIAGAILCTRAKPAAKAYVRFAFALYFALAFANGMGFALPRTIAPRVAVAVAQLVAALGPALLALAVIAALEKPVAGVVASLILLAATLLAVIAVVMGMPALAFAPMLLAVVAILIVALSHWRSRTVPALYAALSALALAAGNASLVSNDVKSNLAAALFSAAALLGISLALVRASGNAVEQRRRPARIAIGGKRRG